MCGIFGFVAAGDRAASTVLEGLRYLEYRGYDSWGVATAHDGWIAVDKSIGQIASAVTSLPDAQSALGHTRWATHGGVTEANAHPHADCTGRFALIHNGIVENHQELRASLTRHHDFHSQTDTEVLVHLLEESMHDGWDLLDGLLTVFRQVEGLSAVAVLDARTGQIAVAKNGSPLVLGWGRDAVYLASDPIALFDHTRDVTFLEDGQAATLTLDGIRICQVRDGAAVPPQVRTVSWDTGRAGLDGFGHFMEKEIHEQPRILREIADTRIDSAVQLAGLIEAADNVYLVGCGTAYNASLSGRYLFAERAGKRVTAVQASEMSLVYPELGPRSLVIALSQSGETIDVLEAVREARAAGATVAALVNAEGSTLDRFSDLSVLLSCGPERCVLATKSYTAKLGVLQLTAAALAGDVQRGAAELREASYRVEAVLDRETVKGDIAAVARRVADQQHLFILGRHRNYPPALEAALKIKEVSYMHAEGIAAGELKHGVIALITYGTPCLVLAPDAQYRREILAAAAEVSARGALTIGLSPRPEDEFAVTLPVAGSATGMYEIAVTSQLLAYELALLRGCDPDKPRNLAKSVTVK